MVELREFDRADSITVTTIRPNTTVTPSAITSANPCSSEKSRRNRLISDPPLLVITWCEFARSIRGCLDPQDGPAELEVGGRLERPPSHYGTETVRSGELPGERGLRHPRIPKS